MVDAAESERIPVHRIESAARPGTLAAYKVDFAGLLADIYAKLLFVRFPVITHSKIVIRGHRNIAFAFAVEPLIISDQFFKGHIHDLRKASIFS